jgi:hypothetical protein
MKTHLTVGLLSLVGAGAWGCASAPPPPPEPLPVASAQPAPPRVPTLSVQTLYAEDGLTLTLRLDGAPVSDEVRFVDPTRLDALVSPGEPISAEDAAQGRAVRANGGELHFAPGQLASWTASRELDLVVAGRRYPYPQLPGAWAFGCAVSVVELGRTDACTQPVPASQPLPPHCDASGQTTWDQIRARLAGAQEGCWRSLDEATLAQLPLIQDQDLRREACSRAIQAGGEQASLPVGIRLVGACEAHLPAALRQRWLLPQRQETLAAAYQAARAARVEEQYRFYLRYRITKDPRVEEIRKQAARTHGPSNPARFLAAAHAVEAYNGNDRHVRLCSFNAERVRMVYSYTGGYYGGLDLADPAARTSRNEADLAPDEAREPGEGERRSCEIAPSPRLKRMVVRRRPDPLQAQIDRMAVTMTGAREVERVGACSPAERWYLIPPSSAELAAAGEVELRFRGVVDRPSCAS